MNDSQTILFSDHTVGHSGIYTDENGREYAYRHSSRDIAKVYVVPTAHDGIYKEEV